MEALVRATSARLPAFAARAGEGEAEPQAAIRRRIALGSLAALALLYVALAVPVAASGSTVVLAAAERSPHWLLGPWRVFGVDGADGKLTGPLFYAGLWLAMFAYVLVLVCARAIGPRLAIGSIAAFHVLFLLAPPLLSQDVFSYLSYARLDVVHSLNPYTHSPNDVPSDAVFAFAGSKDSTSVYGPLFTLATYPLAKLSVPAAFWTFKTTVTLASLGIVALAWSCAHRLGRDPVFVALAIGLNPLVLVHVIGGAHNDALVVLLLLAAILAALRAAQSPVANRARESLSGFFNALATGIKLSAGLVLPFLVLGMKRKAPAIMGIVLATGAIVAVSLVAFGGDALDAIGSLGDNQDRTSRWSLPQRSADGIGALTSASPGAIVDFTRAGFGAAFAVALVLLLYRTWKAPAGSFYWVTAAGWATLALLLASAWLVPWYAIWLVPLAALAASRALLVASLALCAYMLVIAVPL
jgi:alpha-1,6-mannosyltransferase